ncbi:MAG TPA: hypothetical protein VK050_03660 [Flavobacteriaceae bacterium]|nr:hypothetical protein [Flavobacteriaceae bacterium]
MKRIILFLVIALSFTLFSNCSLKHKWRSKQKEKFSHQKQEQISRLQTTERVVVDTSWQYAHTQLKNYQLWALAGNVKIHPDGSLESDHATLQSWQSKTDEQQTAGRKNTYQTQKSEKQTSTNQTTSLQRKSSHKEKRKANINLWWLLVLLLPLGIWWGRKRRL